MSRRVLLVEDDAGLAQVLCHNLAHEGFDVQWAPDGETALEMAEKFAPDLALLDLALPGYSGFDLCAKWRQRDRFPIIMVTSRDSLADKLRGLNEGADDYVSKPFLIEELVARMRAILRRSRPFLECQTLGSLAVDFQTMTATKNGVKVELSEQEFKLPLFLAERPNRAVPRDELLRQVWGYLEETVTRSVDKAVLRLRKKIEADPHNPMFLLTAHGGGYRPSVPPELTQFRAGTLYLGPP